MKQTAVELDRTDRLQVLDLMRFVAAMSVLIYHLTYRPAFLGSQSIDLFPFLQHVTKFGYLGVELFFMISGFVILWSASGRTTVDYVASRVSRLVPSLWAAIAITSIVLVLCGRDGGIVRPSVILANMTLIASYVGLPYIDGVYWTLQPEIRFYILVFILILIRQMPRLEYWLIAWLVGLAIAFTPNSPGLIKSFVIFPYGSYFVAGSLFFLVWRDGPSLLRFVCLAGSLAVSILCVIQEAPSFMNNDNSTSAVVTSAVMVVVFYALFLAIALHKVRLPQSTWWYTLGALTYPLYLLHNQIGKAIAATVVTQLGESVAIVLGMIVPLTLAWILAKTVEKKGCPWLRKLVSKTAGRLGFVARPEQARP